MRSVACLRAFWYVPQKSASWTQLTATFSDANTQKRHYWMVKAERISAYANALVLQILSKIKRVVSFFKVRLHPRKHKTR